MKNYMYLFILFLAAPLGLFAKEKEYEASTLHIAAAQGNYRAAQELLAKQADPNIRDSQGNTPLHVAKNLRMTKLLVKNGADVNAQNKDGLTRLHLATLLGHFRVVDYLLSQNANPNIHDKNQTTPLHLAMAISYFENLNINKLVNMHALAQTLMALPLIVQAAAVLAILSKASLATIKTVATGTVLTPTIALATAATVISGVQIAARYRIVTLLIKNRAYLNARDKDGNTPLHILASGRLFKAPFKRSSFAMAEFLILNGAKRKITNKDGMTPYDIAQENNRLLLLPVLNPEGLVKKVEGRVKRDIKQLKYNWPRRNGVQPPIGIPEDPYNGGFAR